MARTGSWDVIVVGAGHAGCEAALAAARMGSSTLMLTMSLDGIGQMSCNPAVGGTAKGHLVREIDALGGEMGRVTDLATIQFRTLNASRGPAVRSSRAQCDRARYRAAMKGVIEHAPNLDLRQGQVSRVLVEAGAVIGVEDTLGVRYRARAVVVTAGTFLRGLIHVGLRHEPAGRAGEFAAVALSDSLRELGLTLGRLKTGTSPRLRASTIAFERLEAQWGDPEPWPFHWAHRGFPLPQVACHITYTTAITHALIAENLDRSPLYSGVIEAAGVRYCPSIEDKIHRFPDRDRHQVILEPDGLDTEEVYANGISTSLPMDVQEALVRSIPGLERAEIMRPGYAIEYDFVPPTQMKPTLETRAVPGLYLAGQINGTTGYEEAGALGLWAGANAACAARDLPPFLPDRSEAYMAVMVDDLVTRGTIEPYRMFTSRAEYRLLLREDNADLRMAGHGYRLGLVDKERYEEVEARRRRTDEEIRRLSSVRAAPSPAVNDVLRGCGARPIEAPTPAAPAPAPARIGLPRYRPPLARDGGTRCGPGETGRGRRQVRGVYRADARGREALQGGRGTVDPRGARLLRGARALHRGEGAIVGGASTLPRPGGPGARCHAGRPVHPRGVVSPPEETVGAGQSVSFVTLRVRLC